MAIIHLDAVVKAKELGATGHSEGINWCWCTGFPTESSAVDFDKWCKEKGYETRGIYPKETTFDVRFRKDSDISW